MEGAVILDKVKGKSYFIVNLSSFKQIFNFASYFSVIKQRQKAQWIEEEAANEERIGQKRMPERSFEELVASNKAEEEDERDPLKKRHDHKL